MTKVEVLLCLKCRRIILPCEGHDYKHGLTNDVINTDYRILLCKVRHRFD